VKEGKVLGNISDSKLSLYHTGFSIIDKPDIHYGRKNADFGQGFYLSLDMEFTRRWIRASKDSDSYINYYELDLDGLSVKKFLRDKEWIQYIQTNRKQVKDLYSQYDVIIGPIANDTLFDLNGITTSGYLNLDQSLEILKLGVEYRQVVIKTEKAASNLKFLSSDIISREKIDIAQALVAKEEEIFQEEFANLLQKLLAD